MVIGIIATGVWKAAQLAFKYRHQIVSVITAQDRAIKGAFIGTRVSKAGQYGWRTGAAAGGLIGSTLISSPDDDYGDGEIPWSKTPTGSFNKTYGGKTRSGNGRYQSYSRFNKGYRRPNYCKPRRSRNR